MAFYYESVKFEYLSLVSDLSLNSHDAGYYTQIDPKIDFDLGNEPMVLKSGKTFPTQYFSVKWIGYL